MNRPSTMLATTRIACTPDSTPISPEAAAKTVHSHKQNIIVSGSGARLSPASGRFPRLRRVRPMQLPHITVIAFTNVPKYFHIE